MTEIHGGHTSKGVAARFRPLRHDCGRACCGPHRIVTIDIPEGDVLPGSDRNDLTANSQEKVRAAGNPEHPVREEAASGGDAAQVGMELELLAPSVGDREKAEPRSEMLGIGLVPVSGAEAARKRMLNRTTRLRRATSASCRGSVKTKWKCWQSTSSAWRAAHWHLGQLQLRQER